MATSQFDFGHHRTWALVRHMVDIGYMLAILTGLTYFGDMNNFSTFFCENGGNDGISYIVGNTAARLQKGSSILNWK